MISELNALFVNRSGRVIGTSRLALACVFLVAVALDSRQPSAPYLAYTVLTLYLVSAAGILAATWSRWWLERRLGVAAHLLDIGVFTVMVFLTGGYSSPFFTFFVFLLLSATIRWGWRDTAITALCVAPLFLVAGAASLHWAGGEFEFRRVLIRGAYLLVLSAILIWFGIHQRSGGGRGKASLATETEEQSLSAVVATALKEVAVETGSERVLFAWGDGEEPWLRVSERRARSVSHQRFAPDRYGPIIAEHLSAMPFLFDVETSLVLIMDGARRMRLVEEPNAIDPAFLAEHSVGGGLVIPIEGADYQGHLLALDIGGLSPDFLRLGARLSVRVAGALERFAAASSAQTAAAGRARLDLARDLHDNIVQLLAGTSFRLESIRTAAAAARGVDDQIDDLQQELSRGQSELRGFITRLRSGAPNEEVCDILGALAGRLSRQWGVNCRLAECAPGALSGGLSHEVQQLVREGVANAVKHGGARQVEVSFANESGGFRLEICDDGIGLNDTAVPKSLSERVGALGGNLQLASGADGCRVLIRLPSEPA